MSAVAMEAPSVDTTEKSSVSDPSVSEADEFSTLRDEERVEQAMEAIDTARYFCALQLFQGVRDQSILTDEHRRIIAMAQSAADAKKDLLSGHDPTEDGWKRQSEVHGHRDTAIYYKVHDDISMTSRIETPIEESLLLPVIAVFNESELYHTWMPRFRFPVRLGMSESKKLLESGVGNQVISVKIDMPFPFKNRECVQHAYAVDSIEEDKSIVIKVKNLDAGEHHDGLVIDPVEPGYRRVDFDASIMIRSCPPDHPLLAKSKAQYPEGERLILLSVLQTMDAHVAGVPLRLINFFNRTVLGRMWGSLLSVAEGIRDGDRPEHRTAIDEKQELYGWVEQRVQEMYKE